MDAGGSAGGAVGRFTSVGSRTLVLNSRPPLPHACTPPPSSTPQCTTEFLDEANRALVNDVATSMAANASDEFALEVSGLAQQVLAK